MKIILKFHASGIFLSLLLLCSCATKNSIHPQLPADASINKGAGRGDYLLTTLHLKDGKELLFIVDTGFPNTILDKSLESKLGKCLGKAQTGYVYYGKSETHIYKSPELYIGNTRLVTGKWVYTDDLTKTFGNTGPRINGILGIDCLQNYCIQLDFADGKIRFLDSDQLKTENLGKEFHLTFFGYRMRVGEVPVGVGGGKSWIDTGEPNDGAIVPKLFDQELKNQKGIATKEFKIPSGGTGIAAKIPNGTFGGLTYTNLVLLKSQDENLIGLRFMARHLVTFNFPKRTMYLKQTSVGPL
jgi:hypothetical protein